jgi:hypothetical protein
MEPFRRPEKPRLPPERAEDAAAARGRLRAKAFDAALREVERREREERLERLAWSAPDEILAPLPTAPDSHHGETIRRLQSELDRFSRFHDAVLASRPWRLIQLFRRLFGRGW